MDGRTDGRTAKRTDGQGKNIWPSDYRQAGHKNYTVSPLLTYGTPQF